MNKWVQLVLIVLAVALIIYNATVLDFEALTEGDSGIRPDRHLLRPDRNCVGAHRSLLKAY